MCVAGVGEGYDEDEAGGVKQRVGAADLEKRRPEDAAEQKPGEHGCVEAQAWKIHFEATEDMA